MSNIIEGDSVKNFGEFIPNPYIEKITVTETETTNIINLNIEYSLLFLVGDQFDINDVADLFSDNTIVTYGMLGARTTNSPSTKEELISDIQNQNIDSTTPIRTNAQDKLGFFTVYSSEAFVEDLNLSGEGLGLTLATDSDFYDSQDRQILKIYCSYVVRLNTANLNEYYYLYLFCSTLDQETITNAKNMNKSLLSLNIGDITYEKIFSPGLIITSDEQNVYAESNGSKFGFTPLLSTDRNFYSTNTVTREMVIDKTQTLVNRFKNGENGTLTDMVNSVEFVLQTQGQTEDLIPELDKVRKSFPNKTNNNPVGNLYASLSQLLININSAFPQTDKLERQKYSTGKVLDARGSDEPNLLTLTSTAGGSYFADPLITRVATDDGDLTTGAVFFNFEEMIKNEAQIFTFVDVERFYEVCEEYGLHGLKRALFSYCSQDNFSFKVATFSGFSFTDISGDFEIEEYNYSFQESQNLAKSYYFTKQDPFSSSTQDKLTFTVDLDFSDNTQLLFKEILAKFNTSFDNLKTYQEQAIASYSYNLNTQKFNNFFADAIKPYWDEQGGSYPWQAAPVIYGIILYLTTDNFDSIDNVKTYTKNIIFNISPETGNTQFLSDFVSLLQNFRDGQYNTLLLKSLIMASKDINQQIIYSTTVETYEEPGRSS
jgi:hypothetical protein